MQLIEEREDIRIKAEALYKLAADLQRGDVLTHDAIREVVGCEPHEDIWPTVVNKVRRWLQDRRGIATWPEVGLGYRLLTKDEQLTFLPAKRTAKALRQIRRARKSVDAIDPRHLTPHQRRVQAARAEALRLGAARVRFEQRRAAAIAAEAPARPRPRPVAPAPALVQARP